MKLSERAEEILETMWISTVEERQESLSLGLAEREEAVAELTRGGYIQSTAGRVVLKEKGRREGEQIVRRHRLAERLLTDVLDVKKSLTHEAGCRFEHVLQAGIEENVCTLLGHPQVCPHGKPIPRGKCCRHSAKETARLVCALKDLGKNERGCIAYLATNNRERLQRLIAMGVLPGLSVKMVQTFPSYVFRVGQSEFAVDREMAEGVYVRVERSEG